MEAIFLTGATGFIGAYVLAELLRRTTSVVYCLVRREEDGMGRLRQVLSAIGAPDPAHRVVAVAGDLSQPLLGLGPCDFDDLNARIDSIVHCGALVSFARPYPALKATNVIGTQEVLRLACRRGDAKPVHYCSTLRVFSAAAGETVTEDSPIGDGNTLNTGYAQSKWVAERLIQTARDRGVPVSLYRPGMVTGHSQSGHSNLTDLMCRLIRGCVQLGCAFSEPLLLDLTAVDYVSSALCVLSLEEQHLGGTYHLVSPKLVAWDQLLRWLIEAGYPLELLPYSAWRTKLMDAVKRQPDHALAPLAGFFREDLTQSAPPRFACAATLAALAPTGVRCPSPDQRLFRVYLEHFVRIGFLPLPPKEGVIHA